MYFLSICLKRFQGYYNWRFVSLLSTQCTGFRSANFTKFKLTNSMGKDTALQSTKTIILHSQKQLQSELQDFHSSKQIHIKRKRRKKIIFLKYLTKKKLCITLYVEKNSQRHKIKRVIILTYRHKYRKLEIRVQQMKLFLTLTSI